MLPGQRLQTLRAYTVKSMNGTFSKPLMFINVSNETHLVHRLKMGKPLSTAGGAKLSVRFI